jgi:organic radical activating enzyme
MNSLLTAHGLATQSPVPPAEPATTPYSNLSAVDLQQAAEVLELLCRKIADGVDHPEIWTAWPDFLASFPALALYVKQRLAGTFIGDRMEVPLRIAHALSLAHSGKAEDGSTVIEAISARYSQSALVQGVVFYLRGIADPGNSKYQLKGKLCKTPFQQLDVLDGGSHLCCASWLKTSVGSCFTQPWEQVWNSGSAQAIRASIHDGSYRYCNKIACPVIQGDDLTPAAELAEESGHWHEIVTEQKIILEDGPRRVNLAYDRTCNLRCPSCRTQAYSADSATRDRFDRVQEENILPMLRHAKTVYITGSGDPFASRNFRTLMSKLGAEEYPDLRFIIMTNGMLFTPKEWAKFPSLHGRVEMLKISIDAASKETHERLRLGAKWETMLENMPFAAELKKQGLIDQLELVFTVQQENYLEMGEACDLAERLGANIYFGRITNWGTFSNEEYERKAICLSTHPEHQRFLEAMQDERLKRPTVIL